MLVQYQHGRILSLDTGVQDHEPQPLHPSEVRRSRRGCLWRLVRCGFRQRRRELVNRHQRAGLFRPRAGLRGAPDLLRASSRVLRSAADLLPSGPGVSPCAELLRAAR